MDVYLVPVYGVFSVHCGNILVGNKEDAAGRERRGVHPQGEMRVFGSGARVWCFAGVDGCCLSGCTLKNTRTVEGAVPDLWERWVRTCLV